MPITQDDVNFAAAMLKHHERAVRMSRHIIANSGDWQITNFAKNIVKTQESEVSWLKTWLKLAKQDVGLEPNKTEADMQKDINMITAAPGTY